MVRHICRCSRSFSICIMSSSAIRFCGPTIKLILSVSLPIGCFGQSLTIIVCLLAFTHRWVGFKSYSTILGLPYDFVVIWTGASERGYHFYFLIGRSCRFCPTVESISTTTRSGIWVSLRRFIIRNPCIIRFFIVIRRLHRSTIFQSPYHFPSPVTILVIDGCICRSTCGSRITAIRIMKLSRGNRHIIISNITVSILMELIRIRRIRRCLISYKFKISSS